MSKDYTNGIEASRGLPEIFYASYMPRVERESEFECASALWNLLDDVDTALDMFDLPTEATRVLTAIVQRRFEHAKDEMSADGEEYEQIWQHQ